MNVVVTGETRTETRYYQRRIEFENVAPILLERRYSHGGKDFLPSEAYARWNYGEKITNIKVSGPVLKKDRTTGQQITSIDYCTPASSSWGRTWEAPAPDWLLELFNIEVPTNEKSN